MKRESIAIVACSAILLCAGHTACLTEGSSEPVEAQSSIVADSGTADATGVDTGRREKLEAKLKDLREKAKRLKERCAELAKRGKEWVKKKDNQHKVCIASCSIADEWGSEFCDVVGVVCAVKIKIGWPLLFCLGAQQICDAGIQNFDVNKCRALCDAKFGGDGGGADASSDASSTAESKAPSEQDFDSSLFPNPRRPPAPMISDDVTLAPDADSSCEACDAELARLEAEIGELERELAAFP